VDDGRGKGFFGESSISAGPDFVEIRVTSGHGEAADLKLACLQINNTTINDSVVGGNIKQQLNTKLQISQATHVWAL
jgi:hypothetical protein